MEKIKNGITELVFIIDKSGSMAGLEADTLGGFNAMIEKQKKLPGECFVTTFFFSDTAQMIHDRQSLSTLKKLTEEDYFVGGGTALLDAIGNAVAHIEKIHKYAREEDVPEHTIFAIITDGEENSSIDFSFEAIEQTLQCKQTEKNWNFLFLGANIDAVKTAVALGIRKDRAVSFNATPVGNAYHSQNENNTNGID